MANMFNYFQFHLQARMQDFFKRGAQQYWARNVQTTYWLRAKRASNFEDRDVKNCMKLWYARFATNQAVWAWNVPTVWMNCARSAPQILKLGMYKTVKYLICMQSVLQIKQYWARNVPTVWMNCARSAPRILKLGMFKTVKYLICMQSVLQIKQYELEMYKQYMDEFRAKRAANFESRNVQNCMKLWYARCKVCYNSIELEM